ncbi:MAG: hypothetical protein OEZ36_00410 [Spirochaetota bacterium]|nr:hypothetical protein [Spirochaetota bacterium]
MVNNKHILETHTAIAWYEEPVLFVECRPNAIITLDDAVDHVERSLEILPEGNFTQLIDMRKLKSISREARVYYSRDSSKSHCKAVALLVKSPLSRVIANFFLGINKPNKPIKLFTKRDSAIHWLKAHI